MPTNKPKITVYAPVEVYQKFQEFQKLHELSMSEAGTIILAEYFGVSTEINKEVITGDILGEIQRIDEKLQAIELKVNQVFPGKKWYTQKLPSEE